MKIVGSLIYYTLALDNTLLVALSNLSAVHAQPIAATLDAIVWLLDCYAIQPSAEIKYEASDICVYAHSDVCYLSFPKARSQVEALIFG